MKPKSKPQQKPNRRKAARTARQKVIPETLAPKVELGDLERVLVQGDLSKLSEAERIALYLKTCDLMGVSPITRPFEYIFFKGKEDEPPKLVLYPTKNCTDQLCERRQISNSIVSSIRQDDMLVVRARVSTPTGRQNEAIGVIFVGNDKGKYLANAMMKAETKAKRRAILGLVGLSWMDEELEEEGFREQPHLGAAAVQNLVGKHVGANAKAIEHQPSTPPLKARERELVDQDGKSSVVADPPPSPRKGNGRQPTEDQPTDRLYPAAPEEVALAVSEGRHMPFIVWVESDGFWQTVKSGGAEQLALDYRKMIASAKKSGGYHWTRMRDAFAAGGLKLKEES